MDAFCALGRLHRAPITCALPREPLRTWSSLTSLDRIADALGITGSVENCGQRKLEHQLQHPHHIGPVFIDPRSIMLADHIAVGLTVLLKHS